MELLYTPITWVLLWDKGIMSFGYEYPWYPKGFFIESNNNNAGATIASIGCIANPINLGMTLQYSYKDQAGNCGIDRILLDNISSVNFVSHGEFYTDRTDKLAMGSGTRVKFIPFPHKQKRIIEMQCRVDIPTNTTIKISYTIDWGNTYTLMTTLVPVVSGSRDGKRWRIYSIDCSVLYYDIAFKVELDTTNTTVTPKLYDMTFTSEDIKS